MGLFRAGARAAPQIKTGLDQSTLDDNYNHKDNDKIQVFQQISVPYTLNDNDNQQNDTMKTKEILYKVQRFNQYENVGIHPNYNFRSLDQLGIFDASKYQLTFLQIFLIIFRKASVTSSRMLSQ